MTFVSSSFIILVALTASAYFACPKSLRWSILLCASYAFLYLNSGKLLLVHLVTTLATFAIGLHMGHIAEQGRIQLKNPELNRAEKKALRTETKRRARPALILGICIDLGILLFLKYHNFFAENANRVIGRLGISIPLHSFLLPIGISFYTLQAIAYLTDIYRGKTEPDKNFFQFALFMSFFPQIVQGPIARHSDLAHQLYKPHDFDYTRLCHGCQLMLWGWFQKMVISDRLAVPVDHIFDNFQDYHGLIVFFAAAGYGLQVYTDFSGGMDIARGVSEILGIELDLNFQQPYFSVSIEDFWRRWHITLGSWMRNYVFYPLSLSKPFTSISRKSRRILGDFVGKRFAPIMAMFIVYVLVGLWHGPQWKYIAYGIWNGIFIVAGILLPETYAKMRSVAGIDEQSVGWRCFQMIRTFVICTLGRLFSRGNGLRAALSMFASIGDRWQDLSFFFDGSLKDLGFDTANWLVLCTFLVLLFVVDLLHERKVHIRATIDKQFVVFRWVIYLGAILAIVIFGSYGTGFKSVSFIYEQF